MSSLDHQKEPEISLQQPDVAGIGATLREARLALGYALDDVAAELRIRLVYLQAIEDGRVDDLPGPAYATGFLRSYGDYLGLDGRAIVEQFKAAGAVVGRRSDLQLPSPVEEGRLPTGSILLVAVLLAAGAYGGWYYMSSQGRDPVDEVAALPARIAAAVGLGGDQAAGPVADDGRLGEPVPEGSSSTPRRDDAAPPEAARMDDVGGGETPPASAAAPAAAVPVLAEQPQLGDDIPYEGGLPTAPAEINQEPAASRQPVQVAAAPEPQLQPEPEPEPRAQAEPEIQPQPQIEAEPQPLPELQIQAALPTSEAELAPPSAPAEDDGAVSVRVVALPPPPPPPAAERDEPVTETEAVAPVVAPAVAPGAGASNGAPESAAALAAHRIVLRASDISWVEIIAGGDRPIYSRLMHPGETFEVPVRTGLTMATGNAGGIEILVDGEALPRLGPVGAIRRDVSLDPRSLLAGAAVTSGRNVP